MDAARSWVSSIAIRGGEIVYSGTDAGAEEFIGSQTHRIDLQGKMVLPGFHDSHVHPVSGGIELGQCNLNGAISEEEVFHKISDYATANPDKKWIVGGGWDLPIFPNANPHKKQLDELVADRPVYLTGADGHSAWVNSRALESAGITKDTPDPTGGRIERDPKTGEPTGTLRELATDLVSKHLPQLTAADYLQGARRGLQMANEFGITSFTEASASDKILEAYAELDRRGELTVRVLAAMYVDPAKGEAQVDTLVAKRQRYQSKNLRANTVKIFADGVIEAQTAALLEPYLDKPGDRGPANFEPEVLKPLVARLDREGFQVHVHAIGDRAIRNALDAFEHAQKLNGKRDSRHVIAHLELIDPEDIPRFRELGVIADFQPLWAYADEYITKLTEPKLGPQRSRWLYPIASVFKTGAVVVGGSDWSVSSMNPLEAMQVAITRRGLEDGIGKPWIPEELVHLPMMLAAYTIAGAYASFQEQKTGALEVGKAADLIILDRNIFECAPQDVQRAVVLLALLGGKEVFRHESFREKTTSN
jgi:predicted amidohydrolase YtcJ